MGFSTMSHPILELTFNPNITPRDINVPTVDLCSRLEMAASIILTINMGLYVPIAIFNLILVNCITCTLLLINVTKVELYEHIVNLLKLNRFAYSDRLDNPFKNRSQG